jgi:O-antigen/teichoic acid export membrane protein
MVFAVAITIIANVVARASALISQIIVGIYLIESQVGAFALALGINGLCCIPRTGGASYLLPTIRPADYDRTAGRYFAWGAMFAGLGGALTIVSSGVVPATSLIQSAADAPGLAPSLVLLGVRQWMFPLILISRSRMAVNHRFGELAKLDTSVAILRLATTWVCAAAGMGALAMAIPIVISAAVEALYCSLASGLTRQSFRWSPRQLKDLVGTMRWPILVASLASIALQCQYLVVGAMVPVSVLGVFYFALQLALQPVLVVGTAFQSVFAPLLTRHRGNKDAETDLISRVFMGSMLLVPVTTLSIGGFFPLLERLVWNGKWSEACIPIAWLSVGATFSTATSVLVGPLLGARHFKTLAGIEFSRAVGVFGGAAIGGVLSQAVSWPDHPMLMPEAIVSAATALGMTVTSLFQLVRVMRRFGLSRGEIAYHLAYGPALSGLTVIGAVSLAHSAAESFALPSGALGTAIELAIGVAVFGAVILLAFRTLSEPTVRAVADMIPGPFRTIFRRALLLGASHASVK